MSRQSLFPGSVYMKDAAKAADFYNVQAGFKKMMAMPGVYTFKGPSCMVP
jgi:hypothetical protein